MTALPSFSSLSHAFLRYLNSLPVEDDEIHDHIHIKKTHTYRVIGEIRSIAIQSGLSDRETELVLSNS
jgi:hypothetical protein